ncbi:hypothetical protein [Ulvibacterium sp.]|uniref:hypothetical protein n=1 Tax=Ulvibacterium sp. TaxID=2665914 RepID=UPI003CC654EF
MLDDGGYQEMFYKKDKFDTRTISNNSGIVADVDTDPHDLSQEEGHNTNEETNPYGPDGTPTNYDPSDDSYEDPGSPWTDLDGPI